MKNRFLIAKNGNMRFGPDIGDLSQGENFAIFKKEIHKAIRDIRPDVVVCDLHPGYFSAKLARQYNPETVQHHHAHIASVMQECALRKPVIGVSFDGTGQGSDGNIWGGEFLLVQGKGFKRLAHLKYYRMPGGEKAIKEPWRMVLSILGKEGMPFVRAAKKEAKLAILLMLEKNINSPLTSSAGRLFDACAALLGISEYASYEAEGPIRLERMCRKEIKEAYRFGLFKNKSGYIIDTKSAFLAMIKDLKKGKTKDIIATKFHNTIADIIIETIKKLSSELKIKDIAISGGVFQNRFLKEKAVQKLKSLKFNVFTNNKTPVNDLNISLGQYYVSCGSGKN